MQSHPDLEKRMYFFVPYNISPIQQGIQAGHAALKYAHEFGDTPMFEDFVVNWQTWMILNGGTTNSRLVEKEGEPPFFGSLNNIHAELSQNNIPYSTFREPDLQDALTAVCFIADERVFNYEDYPDFIHYLVDIKMYSHAKDAMPAENLVFLKSQTDEWHQATFPEYYQEWIEFLGGEENVFLRKLLKGKKFA